MKIVETLCASVLSLCTAAAFCGSTAHAESGLLGYWKFDEGSGTALQDFSGNGNTGTVYGATRIAGRLDKALDEASGHGWPVISVKDAWKIVFAP